MRGDVTIREARPKDNSGLIALDAVCSMGEAVALGFDRSPDFFARAAAYEKAIVLVAEMAGRIVGVGAAAIKVLRVGGTVGPWAYLFDLRVAPEARRRGVAGAVAARRREAPPSLLVLPYDPEDPAFACLAAGAGRDAGVHLFVQAAAGPPVLRCPVFLDPADL